MTTPNQGTAPAMRSMELTPDEWRELKGRAAAGYAIKKLATASGGDGLFIMQTRREFESTSQIDGASDQAGPDINHLDIAPVPDSDHLVLLGNQEAFAFLRGLVMWDLLDKGAQVPGQSSVDIIEGPIGGPRSPGQALYARLYEISMQSDAIPATPVQ